MTANFCTHCGASLLKEYKFCANCGQSAYVAPTGVQTDYVLLEHQPTEQPVYQQPVYEPVHQQSVYEPVYQQPVREPPQPSTHVSQTFVTPPPVFQTDRKNPGVAAVLSFFWAGLGQIYNGQLAKGIGFMVLYAVCVLLIFVVIGLLLVPVVWIIGIWDAYNTAKQYNERQIQNEQAYSAALGR